LGAGGALELTVLDQHYEAHLMKLLCSCPSRPAGQQRVQVLVASKAVAAAHVGPGSRLRVQGEWWELGMPPGQLPVLLAQAVVGAD